jgi:hypothetical protein
LRNLVDGARNGASPEVSVPDTSARRELKFEQLNVSPIMSPWEIRCHSAFVFEHAIDHPKLPATRDRMDRFADAWAAVWAQFGPSAQGVPSYRKVLEKYRREISQIAGRDVVLRNTLLVRDVLDSMIFVPALVLPAPTGNIVSSLTPQRLAL